MKLSVKMALFTSRGCLWI